MCLVNFLFGETCFKRKLFSVVSILSIRMDGKRNEQIKKCKKAQGNKRKFPSFFLQKEKQRKENILAYACFPNCHDIAVFVVRLAIKESKLSERNLNRPGLGFRRIVRSWSLGFCIILYFVFVLLTQCRALEAPLSFL